MPSDIITTGGVKTGAHVVDKLHCKTQSRNLKHGAHELRYPVDISLLRQQLTPFLAL